MITSETPQQTIDRLLPYRGKCAFCDHPDARHRLIDSIQNLLYLGESIEDIAEEFEVDLKLVEAIQRLDGNGLAIDSRLQ